MGYSVPFSGRVLRPWTRIVASAALVGVSNTRMARWVRLLEDMEEEKATVWELGIDLASRLALYATPVGQDGQGLLYQVAERMGPGLLAECDWTTSSSRPP